MASVLALLKGGFGCRFQILEFWETRFFLLGAVLGCTWTPKVCKIMAFMAVIMGLGLLFYMLLGFRQGLGIIREKAAEKNMANAKEM